MTLAPSFPYLFPDLRVSFHRPTEFRVDVDPAAPRFDASLPAIYDRVYTPGDRLHDLPVHELPDSDLKIRARELHGEVFVYVEDVRRGCPAGCTAFNRLVEVGFAADKHLRSPHSRYRAEYQRRGIASGVYKWALERETCLITGARQSPGAYALWQHLAQRYEAGYVDVRSKRLTLDGHAHRGIGTRSTAHAHDPARPWLDVGALQQGGADDMTRGECSP